MTYEGARGIIGPYLALLGASAPLVGLISGLGEFIGYGLRLFSGFLVDKLKAYWAFIFFGYTINLLAVPALALVDRWDLAALLIILERAGKALRTPARDTLLSFAVSQLGRGKGFAIHEALDQIGAILGPIIVAYILAKKGNYKEAFLFLFIPALLALTTLVIAKKFASKLPQLKISKENIKGEKFPKGFWLYIIGLSFIGAGFVDFPLIGYYFQSLQHLSKELIPFFYALAMGVDALSALIFGWLYDRKGFVVVLWASLIPIFGVPLIFLTQKLYFILVGIMFWGIGLGAQESIMRAVIAEILPREKRGSGFGLFYAFFGCFWFLGSFLLGIVYNLSLYLLVICSVGLQVLSLPLFFKVKKELSLLTS